MSNAADLVDGEKAVDLLMHLLAVEGVTGKEAKIAEAVRKALEKAGVPAANIRFDDVNKRIPVPTETGNLIATLPGTRPGPGILFSCHLDTVPLCAGAVPKRDGDKIVSEGNTALGGDNRTGCAVLVTVAETLIKHKLPHPPLTFLFTVREESGLHGAREMNAKDLGDVAMCINIDGQKPADLIIGAVGQENWEVEITGKASHAGVAPEKGISATMVASIGLVEARKAGWFGKVVKGDHFGSSNVGIFGGKDGAVAAGDATNVVTDYAWLKGEARSPDAAFAVEIAEGYRAAFEKAGAEVKDSGGETAVVKFTRTTSYPPFRLKEDEAVVKRADRALGILGITPNHVFSNGGLDANWLDKAGIPTVTISAGQAEIHTVKEYVNVPEYVIGCKIAVLAATLDD
ncbi:M20/M25/M40 family metallo-hydrolase [Mesorhizobium sp. VNQ89]|uniref:M20/M25/M40 family metallo-hydrolase n=1 Tax=Mesorhizobium quangtriensis TaxID=3157709 RepID=UPI0032B78AF1